MLLEVKNLNKKFGSVSAANNINFKMNENEIIGVIGANGAGKTTFCNIITGYLKARQRSNTLRRQKYHKI